jgi:hypothetical protein
MAGRRAKLIGLLLLALTGCEQLDSLRQGVLSTYSKELRTLAEDIDRKELAKIKADDEQAAQREEDTSAKAGPVEQAQWHAAPLTGAVQLRPPVPLTTRSQD